MSYQLKDILEGTTRKAVQDDLGNSIRATYGVKLTVSGRNVSLVNKNGTVISTIATQDTNTTYTLSSFGITATATELNYTDGVTSNIQTQLNSKASTSHTHLYAGSSTVGGSANNSNALGGLSASNYKRKLNGNISDFNSTNAITEGEWTFGSSSTISNGPQTGSTYGKLITFVNDGGTHNNKDNWLWQIALLTNNQPIYVRNKTNNNAYSSWQKIYTTYHKPTPAEIGAIADTDTLILVGTI